MLLLLLDRNLLLLLLLLVLLLRMHCSWVRMARVHVWVSLHGGLYWQQWMQSRGSSGSK